MEEGSISASVTDPSVASSSECDSPPPYFPLLSQLHSTPVRPWDDADAREVEVTPGLLRWKSGQFWRGMKEIQLVSTRIADHLGQSQTPLDPSPRFSSQLQRYDAAHGNLRLLQDAKGHTVQFAVGVTHFHPTPSPNEFEYVFDCGDELTQQRFFFLLTEAAYGRSHEAKANAKNGESTRPLNVLTLRKLKRQRPCLSGRWSTASQVCLNIIETGAEKNVTAQLAWSKNASSEATLSAASSPGNVLASPSGSIPLSSTTVILLYGPGRPLSTEKLKDEEMKQPIFAIGIANNSSTPLASSSSTSSSVSSSLHEWIVSVSDERQLQHWAQKIKQAIEQGNKSSDAKQQILPATDTDAHAPESVATAVGVHVQKAVSSATKAAEMVNNVLLQTDQAAGKLRDAVAPVDSIFGSDCAAVVRGLASVASKLTEALPLAGAAVTALQLLLDMVKLIAAFASREEWVAAFASDLEYYAQLTLRYKSSFTADRHRPLLQQIEVFLQNSKGKLKQHTQQSGYLRTMRNFLLSRSDRSELDLCRLQLKSAYAEILPELLIEVKEEATADIQTLKLEMERMKKAQADAVTPQNGPGSAAWLCDQRDLIRLLQPLDSFERLFRHAISQWAPGTRAQFSEQFKTFIRGQAASTSSSESSSSLSRMFWLLGPPGSGKTVIAAMLCEQFQDHILGIHFCKCDDETTRSPARMIKSLAFQMAARLPCYRELLVDYLLRRGVSASLSDNENDAKLLWQQLFVRPLSGIAKEGPEELRKTAEGKFGSACNGPLAVLLIDALDESAAGGRNPMLDVLASLQSGSSEAASEPLLPPWLGLAVTSRPESIILSKFSRFHPTILDCTSDSNLGDVRRLLSLELPKRMRGWIGTKEGTDEFNKQVEQAVDIVLHKSEGLFLYVSKLLQSIPEVVPQSIAGSDVSDSDSTSYGLTVDDIKRLPAGLHSFYDSEMQRLLDTEIAVSAALVAEQEEQQRLRQLQLEKEAQKTKMGVPIARRKGAKIDQSDPISAERYEFNYSILMSMLSVLCCTFEPLTLFQLAVLSECEVQQLRATILRFHTFLKITNKDGNGEELSGSDTIELYHKSVRDWLTDENRCNQETDDEEAEVVPFLVDVTGTHLHMAQRCFHLLHRDSAPLIASAAAAAGASVAKQGSAPYLDSYPFMAGQADDQNHSGFHAIHHLYSSGSSLTTLLSHLSVAFPSLPHAILRKQLSSHGLIVTSSGGESDSDADSESTEDEPPLPFSKSFLASLQDEMRRRQVTQNSESGSDYDSESESKSDPEQPVKPTAEPDIHIQLNGVDRVPPLLVPAMRLIAIINKETENKLKKEVGQYDQRREDNRIRFQEQLAAWQASQDKAIAVNEVSAASSPEPESQSTSPVDSKPQEEREAAGARDHLTPSNCRIEVVSSLRVSRRADVLLLLYAASFGAAHVLEASCRAQAMATESRKSVSSLAQSTPLSCPFRTPSALSTSALRLSAVSSFLLHPQLLHLRATLQQMPQMAAECKMFSKIVPVAQSSAYSAESAAACEVTDISRNGEWHWLRPCASIAHLARLCNHLQRFILSHGHVLTADPELVYQDMLAQPDSSLLPHMAAIFLPAIKHWNGRHNSVMQWMNKLQQMPSLIRTTDEGASCVTFTPDGSRIISGGSNSVISIWDSDSGTRLRVLRGHTQAVTAVECSQDGRRIVSSSKDRSILVWDAENGDLLLSLHGHTAAVLAVSVHPDGSAIVSASEDCSIRMWDSSNGTVLKQATFNCPIRCVRFSPDGRFLALGTASIAPDNMVVLCNTSNGDLVVERTIEYKLAVIWGLAFSQNRPYPQLIIGTAGCVHFYSLSPLERIWTFNSINSSPLRGVALSPIADVMFVCGDDRTIGMWSTLSRTRPQLASLRGHTDGVLAVACSPDGQKVVSCEHKSIRLWNANSSNGRDDVQTYAVAQESVLQESDQPSAAFLILAADFHSPSHRVALACDDAIIRVFDIRTGSLLQSMSGHEGAVLSVAWNRDGSRLVSGGKDQIVRLWDGKTGELSDSAAHAQGWILSVAFGDPYDHHAGEYIISGSGPPDCSIQLWFSPLNEGGLYLAEVFSGHAKSVNALKFIPELSMIASGSSDPKSPVGRATVPHELFSTNLEGEHHFKGAIRRAPKSKSDASSLSPNGASSIAFSLEHHLLASGRENGRIQLYKLNDIIGCRESLEGHTQRVSSVSFTIDGRLVSASDDGTIRLWDIDAEGTSGIERVRVEGFRGKVALQSLGFTQDLSSVVCVIDGSCLVFDSLFDCLPECSPPSTEAAAAALPVSAAARDTKSLSPDALSTSSTSCHTDSIVDGTLRRVRVAFDRRALQRVTIVKQLI